MSRRFRSVVALACLAVATPTVLVTQATTANAATVPSGFADTRVAGSLGSPTDLVDLPDGRILVTGKGGTLTVIAASGTKVATPALSLNVCTGSEQGLLGVEADPNFATNGYIYLFYGRPNGGSPSCFNRVARFTMTGDLAGSELVLIDNIPSFRPNHEGGDLQFGKDGTLYISSGDDGQDQVSPKEHLTEDLGDLRGKILRINPDGSIPASNPYQGGVDCKDGNHPGQQCKQVVANGLRNPFRIAADPNASSTRLFINDVGEGTSEEIDEYLTPGINYGWPAREGLCLNGLKSGCNPPGSSPSDPIHAYFHGACESITAGAFVPSGAWPARYSGGYLYADYICGQIFALLPDGSGGYTSETFSSDAGPVISMRTVTHNSASAVYYVTFGNGGELRKIVATTAPGITLPSAFHPLTPTRVLDTRDGTGYTGPKPGAGDTIEVQITGASSGVPNDAKAVALNITGTEATAAGFVTVWPSGEERPLKTSAINFSNVNDTVANAAVARLGTGGRLSLYTQRGGHLVIDVTGYWTETATSNGGRYVPLDNPARLLDTREGNGAPAKIVGAEESIDVQVSGRAGLPTTGISAVALVVTVTNTARSGFVTAWPTGATRPLASTVNPVGTNDIRSNLVMLPLSADGKVSLYTLQPTHLVMDVAGYFTDSSAQLSTKGLMVAVSPRRLLDTREAGAPFGRLNAGDIGVVDYSAAVAPANAIAIIHNLTVDGTAFAGFVTAWPTGATRPTASNVNWNGPNQTRASLALSSLVSSGRVSYFPNVGTDLVIDQQGWFVP